MLKGYQKKIVFLKNTGSKIFDEAYFVISEKANDDRMCDTDMIDEANRIISECIGDGEYDGGFIKRIFYSVKRWMIPFLIGASLSVASMIIFSLMK